MPPRKPRELASKAPSSVTVPEAKKATMPGKPVVAAIVNDGVADRGVEAIGVNISGGRVDGEATTIVCWGFATGLAGLTPAAEYFLGADGALVTDVSGLPALATLQRIGKALSTTVLWVEPRMRGEVAEET